MRLDPGETIQRAAIFEADRRARLAREIDDLLQAMPARSASDEDSFQRAAGAQCLDNRVDSDQDGQL
jgi:hypothetical protein